MGTVRFKYDFFLSAYYRFMSGLPYGRTVTVVPPSGWAAANGADVAPVTVYLESPARSAKARFGAWTSGWRRNSCTRAGRGGRSSSTP